MTEVFTRAPWAVKVDHYAPYAVFPALIAVGVAAVLNEFSPLTILQLAIAVLGTAGVLYWGRHHRVTTELRFDDDALTILYDRGEPTRLPYATIVILQNIKSLMLNDINIGAPWHAADGKLVNHDVLVAKIHEKLS